MSRRRRERVVFPEEEGPDMPIRRGGGGMVLVRARGGLHHAHALSG
jgi:hypothetical protein